MRPSSRRARRVVLEHLEDVLTGRMVDDGRDLMVVDVLHVRLEQVVVEELVAIGAGMLDAHHAEVVHAALELVDILGATPGRHDGVGDETALGLLAHVGCLVVHDLADLERQPLLPHGHAQHGDVDADLVHGLDLGLEGVIALDVVQDLLAVFGGHDDLVMLAIGSLGHVGLDAEGDGCRIQEPVQDLLVGEQVRRQEVHVVVDYLEIFHSFSSFSIRVRDNARPPCLTSGRCR